MPGHLAMDLAPIVLFVYNRPWHTEQTLKALAANALAGQSVLYIFADGPKADATAETITQIKEVRKIIRAEKWCSRVNIVESDVNRGLANSIINGVTTVVNQFGSVIVLEDDLITHPFFLTYMNHYLKVYQHENQVISIYGYQYPVKKKIEAPFFLKGADCWGWATWKRGWDLFEANGKLLLSELLRRNLSKEFNFDNSYDFTSLLRAQVKGEVDSWAIRWYASAFLLNKLTLYPPVTLIKNIGFDGSGTHGDNINVDLNTMHFDSFELKTVDISENKKNKKQIELFFKGSPSPIKNAIKKIISRYVRKD